MWTAVVLGSGSLTQQWLLSVEVISHALNLVAETFNLAQHDGQILKHQATRSIRMLLRKIRQIVANAASNVYNEHSIIFGLGALDQPLLNRKEIRVHPLGSALAVAAHVVVELRAHGRVRLHVSEHVEVGGVGVLVGAVGGGVGFAVGG